MEVSREEKKAEAVKRMKAIGMFKGTIEQFEKDNLVSESTPPLGACYWLSDEQKKRVAEFEKEHDALVYHVIRGNTSVGELENYLYVSDYREEWEFDNAAIKDGAPNDMEILAYVNNLSDPICSEFGYIGVKLSPAAGLNRIW